MSYTQNINQILLNQSVLEGISHLQLHRCASVWCYWQAVLGILLWKSKELIRFFRFRFHFRFFLTVQFFIDTFIDSYLRKKELTERFAYLVLYFNCTSTFKSNKSLQTVQSYGGPYFITRWKKKQVLRIERKNKYFLK